MCNRAGVSTLLRPDVARADAIIFTPTRHAMAITGPGPSAPGTPLPPGETYRSLSLSSTGAACACADDVCPVYALPALCS